MYEPAYGPSAGLMASLEKLCGPNTTVFVSLTRRMFDGVDEFLDRVKACPLLQSPLKVSNFVDKKDKLVMFMLRKERRSETFYKHVNSARPLGGFLGQIEAAPLDCFPRMLEMLLTIF